MADSRRIETKLIHAGEPLLEGAVSMPVFQSSTFAYGGESDYHDLRYIRLNNTPNHIALQSKLAALENGEAALVTASGMAAISTALLATLSSGDHLLIQRSVYGGTYDLVTRDLPKLGIQHSFIDSTLPETWAEHVRPNTRAIYVETISNPLLGIPDLKAIVSFSRRHELVSMIDNTFATPVAYRPLEHGFDLCLHSCTKYLNGHTDIVAGAVIGTASLVRGIKHKLDHLGGCLDPHACFLLHRGIKTLAVRFREQTSSASKLAHFLESHPAIARVYHPSLPSHPHHDRARELLGGLCGVVTFVPKGGLPAAQRILERVTIPINTASLGGVESLITRPSMTSHSGMSPEDRRAAGVSDEMVRVSVGLESVEDLIADFSKALPD
jgi:cystathionine beta-lyase/cystathionine gamma-synthase